jgi:hypothetical protein
MRKIAARAYAMARPGGDAWTPPPIESIGKARKQFRGPF